MNLFLKLLSPVLLCLALSAGAPTLAHAASNHIRMYVIVAPGGSADAMARMVGEKLGPHFGDFPAWYISVEAVEKCGINHRFWEWRQQV